MITFLKDNTGNQYLDYEAIKSHVSNFLDTLYTTSHYSSRQKSTDLHSYNSYTFLYSYVLTLDKSLQEKKITIIPRSFKPLKSPRSNSLHPIFFQEYWNDVGANIVNLCKETFISGNMSPSMNKTYYSLFPNVKMLQCSKTSSTLAYVILLTSL